MSITHCVRFLVSTFALLLLGVLPMAAEQASPPPGLYPDTEMNRLDREHPGVQKRFEDRIMPLLASGDAYRAEVERMATQTADPILADFAAQMLRLEDPETISAIMAYEHEAAAAAPPDQVQIDTGDEHFHNYKLLRRNTPMSQLVPRLLDFIQLGLTGSRLTGELREDDPLQQLFLDQLGIKTGSEHEAALIRATIEANEARPTAEENERRRARLAALVGDPEAFHRASREHYTADARKLGGVWGRFVEAVGGIDSPTMGRVLAYMDRHVFAGPGGTSMTSTASFDDPEHFVWVYERAFREGVEAANQKNSPRQ